MYSPVASSKHAFVFPEIPKFFSSFLYTIRDLLIPNAFAVSASLFTYSMQILSTSLCASSEPSAKHNSHLTYVWFITDSIISLKNFSGVLYKGTRIEIVMSLENTVSLCLLISSIEGMLLVP